MGCSLLLAAAAAGKNTVDPHNIGRKRFCKAKKMKILSFLIFSMEVWVYKVTKSRFFITVGNRVIS